MSYHTNIVYDANTNPTFRTVLYTGQKSQLVVMNIPPDGEIGMETHDGVEQSIFILRGSAKAVLDGIPTELSAGDVLIVSSGTEHNIINTGKEELKIYTIYAPPNHLDGRIHATKADADMDDKDEAFGHSNVAGLLHALLNESRPSVPGFLPDVEPRPAPANPNENFDAPPIQIYDLAEL